MSWKLYLENSQLVALPWELLYIDDRVVIAETEDDLIKRLNEWKDNVDDRGMRVNMNKTKVMISGALDSRCHSRHHRRCCHHINSFFHCICILCLFIVIKCIFLMLWCVLHVFCRNFFLFYS